MNVVVIVEGDSDRGVVKAILEKLNIKGKVLRMRGNNPDRAKRLIKSTCTSGMKAIVLKDLHRLPEDIVSKHLKKIQSETKETTCNVQGIIVRKAIEAWILADTESIVTGKKVKIGNPECIDEPDKELDRLIGYVKNYYRAKELASKIRLNIARKRAKSLDQFLCALKDP